MRQRHARGPGQDESQPPSSATCWEHRGGEGGGAGVWRGKGEGRSPPLGLSLTELIILAKQVGL